MLNAREYNEKSEACTTEIAYADVWYQVKEKAPESAAYALFFNAAWESNDESSGGYYAEVIYLRADKEIIDLTNEDVSSIELPYYGFHTTILDLTRIPLSFSYTMTWST